jgi:hypothetical protein
MHSGDLDDELDVDEVEDEELSEEDENASILSIRRQDGTEVVSIVCNYDEWNVHLQPGGAIRSAFIGSRSETPVLIDSTLEIERDDDGTYVIRLD